MNKTALDWVRQELEYLREFEEFYSKRYQEFDQLFNRAKQIEKEQIIEAVDICMSTIKVSKENYTSTYLSGEAYYKERYILKTI